MFKKSTLFIIIVTIIFVNSFTACASNKENESTIPQETISQQVQTEEIPDVNNDETPKDVTYTLEEIFDENYVDPSEEFLKQAIDELDIGFSNYGIDYTIKDTCAYVNHPDSDAFIDELYASNEFLEAHTFKFVIAENAEIHKFQPKTLESLNLGYVEDDPDTWGSIGECYDCVWESSLEHNTGITWTFGEKILIVIDDTYKIYINYKTDIPEDGKDYFEIH